MNVRICTWEYVTTFDGQPSESQVLKQFGEEFPQIDSSLVQLNLMVSFNSAEGRKLRFLVMVLDALAPRKAWSISRRLPSQIWMFGWADEYLRRRSANDECCSGSGLFWAVEKGVLYILVFLEGRLCHWSEESGYEESLDKINVLVEERLIRFRLFLKDDDLFSRCNFYPEIKMEAIRSRTLFKRASRDSFWKNVDLAEKGKKSRLRNVLAISLLGFVVLFSQKFFWGPREVSFEMVRDVPCVELSEPPLVESLEVREKTPVARFPKTACLVPPIRLRGIVAPRLFMAEMAENHKVQPFKLGDSLGVFMVSEIGRNHIELVCNDSTVTIYAE